MLNDGNHAVGRDGRIYLDPDSILCLSPQNFCMLRCCFIHLIILCKASHKAHKLIKQNLTVKHLLGCSENAVKTHLWIAICSYLLLARFKAVYNSPYSISEIRMLIGVSALTKKDLKDLVTEPQPLTTNQDVNELTLF